MLKHDKYSEMKNNSLNDHANLFASIVSLKADKYILFFFHTNMYFLTKAICTPYKSLDPPLLFYNCLP